MPKISCIPTILFLLHPLFLHVFQLQFHHYFSLLCSSVVQILWVLVTQIAKSKPRVESRMGSGDWLKNIINLGKVRKPKSKKMKGSSIHTSNKLEPQPQEKMPAVLLEDKAATRIQTAYRAFKARKTLRHLKGVVKLKRLTQGDFGKKQTSNTLISLQSWSKIQAQIRTRRLHMVEQGGIRRKKLENQLKLQIKLHDLEVEWSDGSHTMDEALARIQLREEAAIKRERAMAYAFSHQWRPNSKSNLGPNDSELATANWGWSWLDRWIVAQPWESRVLVELTPKKKVNTNSPANKSSKSPSMKNSPKARRNRKLSYGEPRVTQDANTKEDLLATK